MSASEATFRGAGFLPMPHLRTLDALHLEAAIRLNADAVLTYDHRLGDAARSIGLEVISPGEPRERSSHSDPPSGSE